MVKKTAIVANTVYSKSKKVAKDVAVTLPDISWLTTEAQAMGTIEVILVGLMEAMETAITKIGIDDGLINILTPEKRQLEFRWVQTVLQDDGTTKSEGCKAFVTGVPKGIPGAGLEVGANIELECTIATTRYQLFVNGKEIILVDRLNGICKINGKDYYSDIKKLL